MAYGAKIMAIKAGQATGSFASTDIAKAINYAAANGADVINMSFGGTAKSALVEAALRDASADCVLVAAAGNDGEDITKLLETMLFYNLITTRARMFFLYGGQTIITIKYMFQIISGEQKALN